MALATNIQAHWKFDESSGDATDSKNGNTAVNTSVTYGTGKLNNCAIYNGSAYHTVSDHSTIKPTNAISISLWVNITSTSSYQMLLAKGENASDTRSYEVRCYGTTTQLEMQLRAGGGSYINFRSTTALTTGVWYHVVFTRTGTTNKIYINGVEETLAANSTHSGDIDYSTDALWFGQRNGSYRFNGKLDEISLFNVALTADNAKELFNSGRANAYPHTDTPSLYGGVAYYKLDESSGNAVDSINSNTLTNTNTVTYVAGKINNGADFGTANTNKKLTIASNLGITNGAMSISCWVKLNTEIASGTFGFVQKGNATNHVQYIIAYEYNGGSRRIVFNRQKQNVSNNIVTNTVAMGTSNYYHLVLTYDGSTLEGYVNGTSVGTLSTTGDGSGSGLNQFDIGEGGMYAGTSYASIDADEVFVVARAFTSTEVTALYASGSGNQYPFSNPNATVTPSAVTGTFAIPSATITSNATVSPSFVNATFTVQNPTITAGATITQGVFTGTFAIPAYSITTADTTVYPDVVNATFAIPAYTPSAIQNTEVLPSTVNATFSIPAYTVSTTANPTIAPDTVNATFSILTYSVLGDFWNNKFSDSPDSWNNKY